MAVETISKDDVLTLVKAGYSKAEISALFGLSVQTQEQKTESKPETKTETKTEQKAEPETKKDIDDVTSFKDVYGYIKGLRDDITSLRDIVQANNIINNGTNSISNQQTADEALLEILDPEGYSLKNGGTKN